MKFLDLAIDNFMTITTARIGMSDRGLVLVQGVNECDTSAESNGAGKSTFADALFWCCFGETSRGESGDDIINWVAKKGTRVATNVQDGDNRYEIARHRKHKTGKNSLRVLMTDAAGDVHDLTKGTDKLTQTLVNEILGASREVFISAVLAGQDQMPDLPGMTDKNLKVIVEEAAGTTVLEKGHKLALAQLGDAKNVVLVLSGSVSNIDSRIASISADIIAVEVDIHAWENGRKARVERETKEVRERVLDVKARRDLLGKTDRPAIQAQLDAENAKLAGLAGEMAEERRLNSEVQAVEIEAREWVRQVLRFTEKVRTERTNYDDFDHKIGCPCGTCDKPFTAADIAPAKSRLADNLRLIVSQLRDAKKSNTLADAALDVARSALATHRASMTDASASHALCSDLRASLAVYDRQAQEIEALATAARSAAGNIKLVQAEMNPHEIGKDRFKAARDALLVKHKEELAKLDAAKIDLEIAEEVAKVFAPSGARAEMLDEITPYLNAQTAKYLGTLSDGNIRATWSTLTKSKAGELKEKFAIEVENDQGGAKFGLISGGEKRKVRIAAALALQDLVASRATKPIGLFIGDEIDNALDTPGIERLTTILQEKARERGTVFVISHSDLKDWVPQVMTVTKTARGQSTIEENFA